MIIPFDESKRERFIGLRKDSSPKIYEIKLDLKPVYRQEILSHAIACHDFIASHETTKLRRIFAES